MGWALRVRARVRVVSRVAVPAAGAALGIVLAAQAAHATVSSVTYTGSASPTTGATLEWTIAAPSGDALNCQLLFNGTPTASSSSCPAGPYTTVATSVGSYVLEVTDTTDVPATAPVDSTPVVVAPPAPQPTAPTSPSNDVTPTFGLGLPTGTTGACTLKAPDGVTVVDHVDPCSDPYTPAAGVLTTDGKYTLSVTATDAGITSDPAQVDYTLDTLAPGAVSVAAPSSPGTDATPDFTIAEDTPTADAFTCTLTLPDGSTTTITTNCGVGTLTPTLSGGDGTYTLTVVASDAAGNGVTDHADYSLDTTGPTTPTVSPDGTTGSSRSISFTVTEPDSGVTYTCSVSGPSPVTAAPCGPTTTLDLSGLKEGTYRLTVTVADGLGNTTSVTVTYTLDTTPPTAPVVTGPTTGSHNDRSPGFTITEPDADATLSCVLTGGPSPVVVPCDTTSTTTLDLSSAADGPYQLKVTATDAYGNAVTTTVTYNLDTTPPPAPTVASGSASPGKGRTPSWTVADGDPTPVTYTCSVTGPAGFSATVTCSSGSAVSLSITAGSPDGLYSITVTAVDAAGNPSATSLTIDYVYDTTGPRQPSTSSPKSPDNARSVTWTITGTEPGETYTCSVSGAAGASVTCAGTTLTLTLTGAAADGTYTITLTPVDSLGNQGTPLTLTYDLDTTGPLQPSASSPKSPDNARSATWTITGTESVETYLCATSDPDASVSCSGNTVTLTLDPSAADGVYTVTVTPVDYLGNPGVPLTLTYELDTIPPPAPTVASGSASPGRGRSPSWTVADGDRTPVTYTCSVTGPAGFSATVTCSSGSAVSLSITAGSPDGLYSITVTAVDAAGNPSATSLTIDYVYDTTGPLQPSASSPKSPDNARSVTWTITGTESGETYTCVTTDAHASVTCSGNTVTLTLTGAATDGSYTVTVTPLDALGNPGAPLTLTYVLDSTGPLAPSASSPKSPDNARTVTWTITGTEAGETFTCATNGAHASVTCSGNTVTLTLTGAAADGSYTVTVTPVDYLGNPGVPLTLTYVLDSTGPVRPSASSVKSPDNSPSVTWTITGTEAGETYTCVTSDLSVLVTSCVNGTVTLDLSSAGDGVYTVTVTPVDYLGNPGVPLTLTYELDTTPPPAPTVTAPQSPGNSRSPSFTVTDTETGVHWTCSVTGPGAASVSVCGPTTVLNLTGSPDGTYTVTVSAIDPAGNVSAATTATYRLDTTPPPAPVVTAPASPSHDFTPTYAISDSENGVVLTCVLVGPNGNTLFNGVCPVDGTFDTTGRGDGVYTLTVTATDAANNSSSTSVDWTRDTIAPPAPGVSAPASPAQGRTVTFVVTDIESGVTYTCAVTGPSTVSVTSCGPSAVVNLGGAADGTYTLTVTATDAAANTSTATSASYVLDTTAPNAPTVSATPSPSQGKHATFTIGGVEPGGVLTCTLSGPAGSSALMGGPCGSSVGVDLTGQPDGTYTLTVTVTDAAGNVSVAGSASYTLDTTAPGAPVVSSHASPGNDTTPAFGISAEPGASLTCTVARYFQIVFSGPCGPGGTVNLSGYEDGEFEITIYATDAAGNVGAPTTVVYVLDTTPPDAPVLTPPASPSPVEKPIWLFTAEDGTTATCTVTGPDGQVVQGPVACTSPFTGLFKNLPDGTYVLTVVVTDGAGNASPPATSVFILDRHAPVPPTVLPPSSPDSSRHPVWTISVPKGATLTCTLMFGHQIVYGPDTCPANGSFSLVDMPDGTYTLRVTATDSAGNVSATSVTTYVLDTSRPAAPELAYSSGGSSTDPHPYWGFTLPAGTVGRCELVRDGVVLALKNNCKGAVSFDLTGRPLGTYTVRVYAIDAAGNTSHPMTASFVLGARQSPPPPSGGGGSPSSNPFGGGGGGRNGNGGNGSALGQRQVDRALQEFTNATGPVRNVVKKAAHAVHQVTSSIVPVIHDQVTEHVSKAVQGVVNAVSHAGGGTGFPLLLLVVVGAFLLMQNRIDRRDPKLALASVAADDTVEFQPPPSRGGFGGGIADGRWA